MNFRNILIFSFILAMPLMASGQNKRGYYGVDQSSMVTGLRVDGESYKSVEVDAFGAKEQYKLTSWSGNVAKCTIHSPVDWIKAALAEDGTLVVSIDANTSGQPRTALLGVRYEDESVEISFKQNSPMMSEGWNDKLEVLRKNVMINFGDETYKGELVGVHRNGIGAYHWDTSGIWYIGGWKDDERHGKGIFIVPEGYEVPGYSGCRIQVCEYDMGVRDGYVACYEDSGANLFLGKIERNTLQGSYPADPKDEHVRFDYLHRSNGWYLGETKDGKPEGYGIFIYENGNAWVGEWESGEKTGEGTMIELDGDGLQ